MCGDEAAVFNIQFCFKVAVFIGENDVFSADFALTISIDSSIDFVRNDGNIDDDVVTSVDDFGNFFNDSVIVQRWTLFECLIFIYIKVNPPYGQSPSNPTFFFVDSIFDASFSHGLQLHREA